MYVQRRPRWTSPSSHPPPRGHLFAHLLLPQRLRLCVWMAMDGWRWSAAARRPRTQPPRRSALSVPLGVACPGTLWVAASSAPPGLTPRRAARRPAPLCGRRHLRSPGCSRARRSACRSLVVVRRTRRRWKPPETTAPCVWMCVCGWGRPYHPRPAAMRARRQPAVEWELGTRVKNVARVVARLLLCGWS
jgi:hypothetical protein